MHTEENCGIGAMEYNRSKLPNWKHCQRCGRLYKGLWELLCDDCRMERYGGEQTHSVKSKADAFDSLRDFKPPDDLSTKWSCRAVHVYFFLFYHIPDLDSLFDSRQTGCFFTRVFSKAPFHFVHSMAWNTGHFGVKFHLSIPVDFHVNCFSLGFGVWGCYWYVEIYLTHRLINSS